MASGAKLVTTIGLENNKTLVLKCHSAFHANVAESLDYLPYIQSGFIHKVIASLSTVWYHLCRCSHTHHYSTSCSGMKVHFSPVKWGSTCSIHPQIAFVLSGQSDWVNVLVIHGHTQSQGCVILSRPYTDTPWHLLVIKTGWQKLLRRQMSVWRFFFLVSLNSDKWPRNEKRPVITLEVAFNSSHIGKTQGGSHPYFHWHFYYHVIEIAVFRFHSQPMLNFSLCFVNLQNSTRTCKSAATTDYSNSTCQLAVLFLLKTQWRAERISMKLRRRHW